MTSTYVRDQKRVQVLHDDLDNDDGHDESDDDENNGDNDDGD